MAICEMHLSRDNALGKMTSLTVITPEKLPGPWPVLYLLHGMSDDNTAWGRRSSLERYVDGLPLLVVMPNGERSFYADAVDLPKAQFETLIVRDIVGLVDRTFHTKPTREGRALAGQSMGGYGALKLALKHPDMFCAAASHSGGVEVGHEDFSGDSDRARECRPIMGTIPQGTDKDLKVLAQKTFSVPKPTLRIDCGTDDFVIEDNRRFHAYLDSIGYAHEYKEHPGAHTWDYWDTHIQDTLAFLGPLLGYAYPALP